MGPLGWQETIFIFILALLIFGPKKLPELGKTIGKAITEFRRASSELKSTWDREMAQVEREQESLKEETRKIENEISSSYHETSSNYDNSYYDSGYEYGYGSEGSPSTGSDAASSTVGANATQGAEQIAQAPAAEAAQPGTESVVAANGVDASTVSLAPPQNGVQPEATAPGSAVAPAPTPVAEARS